MKSSLFASRQKGRRVDFLSALHGLLPWFGRENNVIWSAFIVNERKHSNAEMQIEERHSSENCNRDILKHDKPHSKRDIKAMKISFDSLNNFRLQTISIQLQENLPIALISHSYCWSNLAVSPSLMHIVREFAGRGKSLGNQSQRCRSFCFYILKIRTWTSY